MAFPAFFKLFSFSAKYAELEPREKRALHGANLTTLCLNLITMVHRDVENKKTDKIVEKRNIVLTSNTRMP